MSACLLVACSSPQPSVLAMIFDIPPPGKDRSHDPVIGTPRRTPFVDPNVAWEKRMVALEEKRRHAPLPTDWAEVYKKLPKDDDDNIDWMAALKDKIITPRAGIDPNTPQPHVKNLDIELSTSGKPERLVVFPHSVHTQWLVCANCHPAIFKKEAGADKITMDKIDDGKYCGVCHDKVAIAEPSGCKGCHKVKRKKS